MCGGQVVFAAGDCLYEKKIILRHLGLLLAALFISVGRGSAAEFEAEAEQNLLTSKMKGGGSAHDRIH